MSEGSEVQNMHYVPIETVNFEKILSKGIGFFAKRKFLKFKEKNKKKEAIINLPKWNNSSLGAQYVMTVFQMIIIPLWVSGVFVEYINIGLGFTIFVYLLYFYESFNCDVKKQLFNVKDQDSFLNDLKNYQTGKPDLCLDIKCYASSDEYGSDENYTYMEEVKFDYDSYVDKTASFPNVFDSYSIVRVENILTFQYNDQLTEYYFESMRRNAIHRCFMKSSLVKIFNRSRVPGQINHMMIKQNKISNIFYSWFTYTLFTLAGLTIFYRIIFNIRTPFVQNYIHKVIEIKLNHKKLLDNQLRQADFLKQNNKIKENEYQKFRQFYSQNYYKSESFININNQTFVLSSEAIKNQSDQNTEVLKSENQSGLSKNDTESLL